MVSDSKWLELEELADLQARTRNKVEAGAAGEFFDPQQGPQPVTNRAMLNLVNEVIHMRASHPAEMADPLDAKGVVWRMGPKAVEEMAAAMADPPPRLELDGREIDPLRYIGEHGRLVRHGPQPPTADVLLRRLLMVLPKAELISATADVITWVTTLNGEIPHLTDPTYRTIVVELRDTLTALLAAGYDGHRQ